MHETTLLTIKVSTMALLPLLAVIVPATGALLVALLGRAPRLRNAMVIVTSGVTLAVVAAMFRPVFSGVEIGEHLYRGLQLDLPSALGLGLHLRVDAVALTIALVTAFVYLLSNIYALSYMSIEHAQTRYYSFLLLTLAANLGVFMAGDFFTLFVFFEMMAVASYVLVVHGENYASMTAGRTYLFMSVIGGLVLLGGIAILAGVSGGAQIAPLSEAVRSEVSPGILFTIAAMMIVGFGSKAGLFFLHVWLPEAHPVAPSPASALLSGLMVKVGVYGIIRTANTLFSTGHGAEGPSVQTSIGYALIIVAAVTMFAGMANALMCKNAKELLAYSTISQVGYIVLGVGVAAYLGAEGAMGMGGSLYHIVNHAIFKSALFLCIGVVVFRFAELDITQLGGLWRKLPVTAAVAGLAVLSMVGIPGTAGFASKTLLHHGIVEAVEHSAKISPTHSADPVLVVIEWLFILTAAGTFCYVTKLFVNVFLGKMPRHFEDVEGEPLPMRLALVPLGAIILILGARPNFLLERVVGPALAGFGFDTASTAYHELFNVHTLRSAIPLLFDPASGSVLNAEVVHNLVGISLPVLVGSAYFVLGYRLRVFELRTPEMLSVKVWYEKIATGFVGALAALGSLIDFIGNRAVSFLMVRMWIPKKTYQGERKAILQPYIAGRLYALCQLFAKVNSGLDRLVSRALVDTWLSEPAKVATPHKPTLAGMAYWAADANRLWDRALTAVMVDMWIAEPQQLGVLGSTPLGRLSSRTEKRPHHGVGLGERYRWMGTAQEVYDRLVSTVMIEAWMPEPTSELEHHRPLSTGGHESSDETREVVGPAVPEMEAAKTEGDKTVVASTGAKIEEAQGKEGVGREGKPGTGEARTVGLSESWRLLAEWVKGPGERAWQIILFALGTAVLVVALLIGLGYLKV
ncbi:MAG: hypothetical protein C4521_07105 [Actinobacteria bacterium]|nr:MAG: hypothetical protein C4521_07105 [Actinomycetota bacterium]